MADMFVGEIRLFPFGFAPLGWAQCDGQLLPISQNTALFSLLGTFYGGDGVSTFALPNLQGGIAVGQGQGSGLSNYTVGQTGGEASVTLTTSEIPAHTHSLRAGSTSGKINLPSATDFLGAVGGGLAKKTDAYNASANTTMAASGTAGSFQAHNNMAPYLVLNYCIALQGIYP
jgi:microcystin-dependent protein